MQASSTPASIVISSYNYARYLGQCIDSALAQTVTAQVIVVDDASTDDSAEVIRSYGDQVLFIRLPVNRGQGAALNAGLRVATGEVVLLLDSDDWVLPNRVERIVDVFNASPAIPVIRHDALMVDVDGNPISDQEYAYQTNPNPSDDLLKFGLTLGSTSCIALHRSFIADLGPIPEDCFRIGADYYLLAAAAIAKQLETIRESLTVRRFHAKQLTSLFRTQRSRGLIVVEFNYCKAMSAAELAQRLAGPPMVASGLTWWQQKALYERSKVNPRNGRWFSHWLQHLARTVRAPIPLGRKLGELGRSVALGMLPRRLFLYARWRTHEGRPEVGAIGALSTDEILRAKGSLRRHPND